MMNKNNKLNVTDNDTNLIYKDQTEFFETFYRIRNVFQIEFANSHYKNESLTLCYQNLQALIMLTTGQIVKVVDLKTIKKKEDDIYNLIQTRRFPVALSKIRDLHDELSLYWSRTEILPKVNEENIDESKEFWKEETQAGFREMKKAFYDSFMLPDD